MTSVIKLENVLYWMVGDISSEITVIAIIIGITGSALNMWRFSVLILVSWWPREHFMFPPLNRLSVHPVKDKSIKHDVGRQSYKILKYADGAHFLCCRLVIASRVNHFTKKPRSLTIIKLASNTAPLPFCLSNCHLSFPPSCTLFLYQHTLWLTSLSLNASSLCWLSNQLLFSPRWTDWGGKTLGQTKQTVVWINHVKVLL